MGGGLVLAAPVLMLNVSLKVRKFRECCEYIITLWVPLHVWELRSSLISSYQPYFWLYKSSVHGVLFSFACSGSSCPHGSGPLNRSSIRSKTTTCLDAPMRLGPCWSCPVCTKPIHTQPCSVRINTITGKIVRLSRRWFWKYQQISQGLGVI